MKATNYRRIESRERGAALVTVILISVLLLTASIALLSALGANSANSTDVLSETKAYYAAETGLQAAINVLRNKCDATYAAANANPTLKKPVTMPANPTWLPYDVTAFDGSPANVICQPPGDYVTRTGAAYKIEVDDPDNIGDRTTYSTQARFLDTVIVGNSTVSIADKCSPSASNCTTITYGDATNFTRVSLAPQDIALTLNFTSQSFAVTPLVTFNVEVGGAGAHINHNVRYEVKYAMSHPRQESKSLTGTLAQSASGGSPQTNPIVATFNAKEYSLMGSVINVCDAALGCNVPIDPCVDRPAQPISFTMAASNGSKLASANVTPVMPTRIVIRSTGYGPQRSKKILEAIIRRNFIDNLGSTPGIAMLGPMGPGFTFQPGTSSGVTYSGGGGPSFGVTDPNALQYLLTHPPGPGQGNLSQMTPPPALITDIPSWQQSAAALHERVLEYRVAAEGSGTLYTGGGDLPFPPGNNATGTGVTFCEGNCKVTADGGGVLVVTGTLTNVGDFDFKGLIIVTGTGGWLRNGGGSGQILGSVIIAPYDSNNLAAGFLPPRYQVTGGGSSDVVYTELDTAFDGTGAATDFVQGVAEK